MGGEGESWCRDHGGGVGGWVATPLMYHRPGHGGPKICRACRARARRNRPVGEAERAKNAARKAASVRAHTRAKQARERARATNLGYVLSVTGQRAVVLMTDGSRERCVARTSLKRNGKGRVVGPGEIVRVKTLYPDFSGSAPRGDSGDGRRATLSFARTATSFFEDAHHAEALMEMAWAVESCDGVKADGAGTEETDRQRFRLCFARMFSRVRKAEREALAEAQRLERGAT